MEARFGASLADVRIHHDETAVASAAREGARAFTIGHDIYFGEGQFAPGTAAGRTRLAHELVHVEQQRQGQAGNVSSDAPAAEREARELGRVAAAGSSVHVHHPAPHAVQREATNGAEDLTPQQSDSDEWSGEMCGPGVIDGQVYMCCFKEAPIGNPCWRVREKVFNDCYAKSAKDHRAYEHCLGESNFACCRCLGEPYCKCTGIV
jgi:hypothetical protein